MAKKLDKLVPGTTVLERTISVNGERGCNHLCVLAVDLKTRQARLGAFPNDRDRFARWYDESELRRLVVSAHTQQSLFPRTHELRKFDAYQVGDRLDDLYVIEVDPAARRVRLSTDGTEGSTVWRLEGEVRSCRHTARDVKRLLPAKEKDWVSDGRTWRSSTTNTTFSVCAICGDLLDRLSLELYCASCVSLVGTARLPSDRHAVLQAAYRLGGRRALEAFVTLEGAAPVLPSGG